MSIKRMHSSLIEEWRDIDYCYELAISQQLYDVNL